MAFHKININSIDFELAPQKVKPTSVETSGSYPVPFLSGLGASTGSTTRNIYTDTANNFIYNPSTNTLTTGTIKGTLDGNIKVKAVSSTNATYFVTFIQNPLSAGPLCTDTSIFYNPSTNTLTTTQVNAKLDGPVQTTNTTTNASYYISFVNASDTGMRYSYVSSELYFNPGAEVLTVPEVSTNVLEANHEVRLLYSAGGGGTTVLLNSNTTPNKTNNILFPSNSGTVVLSDSSSISTSTTENRPVFIYSNGTEIVARKCTWGTSMTSGTNYYLMGATSSTAGLVYNTNVKVLTNAIYASAGFYESSDERLKDFQEDIEVNFSYLHNIPKKYYSWKDDATYTRHIGTSAQEVQKYYPELVNTDDNGYLTMNYDKLSVVALKAIDVLHEEVTELKKENAELKERLARLEELILNK